MSNDPSSTTVNPCSLLIPQPTPSLALSAQSNTASFPEPDSDFHEISLSPQLFAQKLAAFHRSFGIINYKVPTIGGRTLDLHRLFVEVTSRGGIEKVIRDRKWKEIGQAFNFPSTITSASFVLRKFYLSLLYHFEQVYYLGKKPPTSIPDESVSRIANGSAALNVFDDGEMTMNQFSESSNVAEVGNIVSGTIDGKFESGYLVTVNVGSETLQGVLYHTPAPGGHSCYSNNNDVSAAVPHQRKRKRHQLALKDSSSRPKANREGYNIFFGEQYARLKPLYHGQEKAITNKIVLLWSRLTDDEKRVYEEKERLSANSQAQ
jgi:hypothetical protein